MERHLDLYCSTNAVRVIKSTGMRWAGYVAYIERNRISNRGVMRIPEVKRLLGSLWLRWDDNIKMDFKKLEWEGVDWTVLAQKRNQWLGA